MDVIYSLLSYFEKSYLTQEPISIIPFLENRNTNHKIFKVAFQTCFISGFIYYCETNESQELILQTELPLKIRGNFIPLSKKLVFSTLGYYMLSPKGYQFLKQYPFKSLINK